MCWCTPVIPELGKLRVIKQELEIDLGSVQGKSCVGTLPERPVVVPSSSVIVPYFTTILTFRSFMSQVTPYTFLKAWLPLAHDPSVDSFCPMAVFCSFSASGVLSSLNSSQCIHPTVNRGQVASSLEQA